MKDSLEKKIDDIKSQNNRFMAIFVSAIVILLVGYGALGAGFLSDRTMITKINNDYAPLLVIQDIAKDNSNLIKILQLLPETTKDDPRYLNAIQESQEFRTEALRRATGSKRGSVVNNN